MDSFAACLGVVSTVLALLGCAAAGVLLLRAKALAEEVSGELAQIADELCAAKEYVESEDVAMSALVASNGEVKLELEKTRERFQALVEQTNEALQQLHMMIAHVQRRAESPAKERDN